MKEADQRERFDVQLANDRMRILVTSQCNLDCFYCHNEGQSKQASFMSASLFDRVLMALQGAGAAEITFSGGEPLLHPEIMSMVSSASSLATRVTLVTNGTLVTPDVAMGLKDAGLTKIRLGVDSLRPNKPRPSVGYLSEAFALESLLGTLGEIGLAADLNVVLTRFNQNEILNLAAIALAARTNIKFFEHVSVARFGGDGEGGAYESRAQVPLSMVEEHLRPVLGANTLAPSRDFGDANLTANIDGVEVRYCRYLCPYGLCALTGTRVDAEGYAYVCMANRGLDRIHGTESASALAAIFEHVLSRGCLGGST